MQEVSDRYHKANPVIIKIYEYCRDVIPVYCQRWARSRAVSHCSRRLGTGVQSVVLFVALSCVLPWTFRPSPFVLPARRAPRQKRTEAERRAARMARRSCADSAGDAALSERRQTREQRGHGTQRRGAESGEHRRSTHGRGERFLWAIADRRRKQQNTAAGVRLIHRASNQTQTLLDPDLSRVPSTPRFSDSDARVRRSGRTHQHRRTGISNRAAHRTQTRHSGHRWIH